MKIAALDFGSNTFLCLIAEVTSDGITEIYSDEVEVVRLGQDLNRTKKFHPEALARAEKCLQKFAKHIEEHKPEKILAMATSAARDAENREELFKLGERYQIPIEIIPGEQEALITYQGAISGQKQTDCNRLIIDIGGGSTEFIFGRADQLLAGESYDIGCVRLTEKFITQQPTPENEIKAVINFVDAAILKAKALMPATFQLEQILAVAGTPTSLAAAEMGGYDAARVDGYILTEEKLKMWLQKLAGATVEEKIKMGIPEGRADVILIGVITLLRTLQIFSLKELVVSTRGFDMELRLKWLAAICVLSFSFLARAEIKFDKQKIELSQGKIKKILTVEVARSPEQHQQGLMFRKKLGVDEGMLFVFAEPRPLEFWMKNTLIDLDIAYFNEKRIAVSIQKMLAPSIMQKELAHYSSGQPALYALEMNAGWFKKNKFSEGLSFKFLPRP